VPRKTTAAREPEPEPVVSTSFKIPKRLHKQLAITAIQEERDMGAVLQDALQAYFSKGGSHRVTK
jgi:hypothetical protein